MHVLRVLGASVRFDSISLRFVLLRCFFASFGGINYRIAGLDFGLEQGADTQIAFLSLSTALKIAWNYSALCDC